MLDVALVRCAVGRATVVEEFDPRCASLRIAAGTPVAARGAIAARPGFDPDGSEVSLDASEGVRP